MRAPLDLPSVLGSGAAPDRDWLTIATVDDAEDAVSFDDELGPLVVVTTHPAGRSLVCRVGMRVAGRGEADYPQPFVAGDEVLVAIPEASPRARPVILCRLCNGIDRFPSRVMGQDSTKNAFAFSRTVAPKVVESDGPIFVRHAPSGAFVSIAADGTITLRGPAGAAMQIGAERVGGQTADGTVLVQLDQSAARATVAAGSAILSLASSGQSGVVAPGTISVSSSGQPAAEHAISAEAVANLLASLIVQLGIQNPGVLTGVGLAALLPVLLPAVVAAAAVTPQLPPVALALVAAFAAATPKPPAVPGQGQLLPGIGCAGTFVG